LRYVQVVYGLGNDLYNDWMKQVKMETGSVSSKVRVTDCLEAAMAPAGLAVVLPKYVAAMGLGPWLLKWHVWLSLELCEYRAEVEPEYLAEIARKAAAGGVERAGGSSGSGKAEGGELGINGGKSQPTWHAHGGVRPERELGAGSS